MAWAFSTETGPAHGGLKIISAFSIWIENAPSGPRLKTPGTEAKNFRR
jgi:hypothetical protein